MPYRPVLVLLTIYEILCLPQGARSQEPREAGAGGGARPVIERVEADLADPAMPKIAIHGEGFGATPQVFLGEDLGALAPLVVLAAMDTIIVAALPPTLGSGSYLLVVQAGAGSENSDMVDVTVGAGGPQGPMLVEVAPDGDESRQTVGTSAAETVEPSGADLETARTIYIEEMAEDLHRHIALRMADEGPYSVLAAKEEADLWMMGTATPAEHREPGQWEEVARILSGGEKEREVSLTASVYVVARGSDEVLWGTEANNLMGVTSTGRGPCQQVARVIVHRLGKAVKKLQKVKK